MYLYAPSFKYLWADFAAFCLEIILAGWCLGRKSPGEETSSEEPLLAVRLLVGRYPLNPLRLPFDQQGTTRLGGACETKGSALGSRGSPRLEAFGPNVRTKRKERPQGREPAAPWKWSVWPDPHSRKLPFPVLSLQIKGSRVCQPGPSSLSRPGKLPRDPGRFLSAKRM